MPAIERIAAFADDLTAWRRDFHAHPELGFEEVRTAGLVAERLASWGIEVHPGIGRTGVVGVLRGRGGGRTIGLRADMDALPIEERSNLPFASKNPGRMHACGHDGHTTMLLGAARYLAETRDFDGTVVFIFQPAEEGLGGARAMLADGLFQRFPCDEVYGLHNDPNGHAGRVGVRAGPAMAGADFFDIRVLGRGAHGAMPHQSVDPIVAASNLVGALQGIVARSVDPLASAVVSVTQFHAGSAYNVVPGEAHLAGTIRTFDDGVRKRVAERMRAIAAGVAAAHGATVEVEIRDIFTVLDNHPEQTEAFAALAREVVGAERVVEAPPAMGSEDFADMLRAVPGCYFWLGGAEGPALHNAGFRFDDAILPVGASLLARVAERRSAA
jgi:amidohydrolase